MIIRTKRLIIKNSSLLTNIFTIRLKDKTIGQITICGSNIGWSCDKEYRNNGYITEAAKAFIEHEFKVNKKHKITAICVIDNTPSERVMQKIGMKFTKQTNNMRCYEIINE